MALSISSTSQVSIFNIPSTQSPKIFPFSVCLNSITLNCIKLQSIVCAAAKQQSGSSVKSNKKRKKKPSPISKDLSFEDLGVLEETESGFEEEEDSGNGKSKRSEAYIPLPLPKPPDGFVIDEQGQVLMAASRRIATIWILRMATPTPLNMVEKAHQLYREGRFTQALSLYSDSLSIAKTKAQKIALHSNRAACFLKLYDFKQAAAECTSVLELDHKHTGALMLRAQTLVTLKEYQSALFDVNRLLELNPSSEVYLNLQARLKTQLSLAPIPEVDSELEEDDEDIIADMSEISEEQEDIDATQEKEGTDADTIEKPVLNVHTPDGIVSPETNGDQKSYDPHSKGWQTIPKPKGHSRLDYSRWDSVEDDSSEEDDEEDEEDDDTHPQYRFRVKNVDIRPVK